MPDQEPLKIDTTIELDITSHITAVLIDKPSRNCVIEVQDAISSLKDKITAGPAGPPVKILKDGASLFPVSEKEKKLPSELKADQEGRAKLSVETTGASCSCQQHALPHVLTN